VLQKTKKEVTENNLTSYVLNDDETLTFGAWWKTLDDADVVDVQYPHERHGLAGKVSNHAKLSVMKEFLNFVDLNCQPNGRQANSYSAQFFFIPKFTRIGVPREGEKFYDEKVCCKLQKLMNREPTKQV
jgi:hypothetical protein